ncbi:hypothetical protein [Neobacillus drentensis]|uniref:hypothetical protein n=1 Tax=Neobacillus drentensis TaxID=220684 RepID=UPI003002A68D
MTFSKQVDASLLHSPFIKKKHDSHYQLIIAHTDSVISDIFINDNELTLQYSSELLLADYMLIHKLIMQIQDGNPAVINDSNSFLGYLANGEPAYIIKNWGPWLEYLNSSKKNCQDASR